MGKRITYETVTRDLSVRLTEEEVAQKSQQLARAVQDIEQLTLEAKEASKAYKAKIDQRKLDLHNAAKAVVTKTELRPVVCSERPDNRLFKVEMIRHDSMEVIETRPMKSEELDEARQGSLFERSTADSSDDDVPGAGPGVATLDTVRAPDTSVACPGPIVDGTMVGCVGKECPRCAGHGMIPVDALDSGSDDTIDDPAALLAAEEEGRDAREDEH